ncbi:hypothetical protein EZL74_12195 [Flavobacterium silvisoli]|uniref:DUF4595 domain-containing protein n=1 Tax=Flavobacterium silvisoli TaxID=2529433 RepID=A0A4Q9YPJ0_9FLAO|nr:hypothetical protein [Flavobacterium silvisoli]TBX65371.1 hypothetical protein EZL74_12195 [Flavobacterium silvisoli]
MKNVIKLLCSAAVAVLAFTSCSSDSTSNQKKLLKRLVEVSKDGSSTEAIFIYDGNKIVSIDSDAKSTDFTYTNNLITTVVEVNNATLVQNTLNYTYQNDLLVKVVSSLNYEMHFVHNTNGTVTYEKTTKDNDGNEIVLFHGVLYYQNGNLVKDERTFDDAGINIISTQVQTYQYDSRNNPLINVLGFNKLLDQFTAASANNVITIYKESTIRYMDTDQVISAANLYNHVCKYDAENYPVEIVSEKPFFGVENSNHSKSQFFYN